MGPGAVVVGLTAAAMAVVTLLAVQAEGARSDTAARPAASGSTAPSPSTGPAPTAPALPAASGTGYRVVYSIGARRVWLVDPNKDQQIQASFAVTPGSVEPTPGSYSVYSRAATGKGTDERQIEHVVRFTQQSGVVFGFSAALDGATPPADPKVHTGGIRTARADGQLMWDFAPTGTRVVVTA
jgi:hypothetical protein